MILYGENPQEYPKKTTRLISGFSMFQKKKLTQKKQLYFHILAKNNWKYLIYHVQQHPVRNKILTDGCNKICARLVY